MSDEDIFHDNSKRNKPICVIWNTNNPYELRKHTLFSSNVNVEYGKVWSVIFVITRDSYVDMLQNFFIRNFLLRIITYSYFHQDSARTYYFLAV